MEGYLPGKEVVVMASREMEEVKITKEQVMHFSNLQEIILKIEEK